MFLRELKTHEERLNRLRDGDYFFSRAYEEQQFLCDRARVSLGARSPVVRFERAAVKRFRAYGIPVFAREMKENAVELVHCQWLDRLSLAEINIYLRLALEAAAAADVECSCGSYWWEVQDDLSPDEYRHRTRDEINAICDEAAAGAQLIIKLQEDIEAAQKALRDEMDRLRRERVAGNRS